MDDSDSVIENNNVQVKVLIDNVSQWLKQHQSETELSESRVIGFEEELTRRLFQTPGARNYYSQVDGASHQRTSQTPQPNSLSTASVSNSNRGLDTFPSRQSRQPMTNDNNCQTFSNVLSPPSCATNSSGYDSLPPQLPTRSAIPAADTPPLLPPRPSRLVTSSQQQQQLMQQQRIAVDNGRGYSMPPAPPAQFPLDPRLRSLPGQACQHPSSFHRSQFGPSAVRQFNHQYGFPNDGSVQNWPPSHATSVCMSTASHQSQAFSNFNYSEYSDNGMDVCSDQTTSYNGSYYDRNLERERMYLAQNSNNNFGQQHSGATQIRTCSPVPQLRRGNSGQIKMEQDGGSAAFGSIGRQSHSRNYSSEAYKFFMEQHIENLIKSCKQRKERRANFDAYLTSQNSIGEPERRQFRSFHDKRESNYLRLQRAQLEPSFFEPLKTLGVGAFGEVSLVRKRDNGKLYAMKTLRKADVIKRNQVAHVKAERDILAEANSDWVVKLFFSFQDYHNLYFIMDYIPGGDLMNLLMKKGIFSEPMARFYTAELVAALEYVHSMGFIHRDIKPDNVLIDREGHVKLTDFGLCTGFRWTHQSNRYAKIRHEDSVGLHVPSNYKEETNNGNHQRVPSLVGTPNYISPEVLTRTGYNHACDWWSVGIILYEMLVGRAPFLSETPVETQYKIIHWKQYLGFPPGVRLSPTSADLIFALVRDVDTRLGAFGGAAHIKAHPFFDGIDFNNLRKQTAIYKPELKHEMDTSHFSPPNDCGLQVQKFGTILSPGPAAFSFHEFTYRRPCDDTGYPSLPFLNNNNSAVQQKTPVMPNSWSMTKPPPLPPRPANMLATEQLEMIQNVPIFRDSGYCD